MTATELIETFPALNAHSAIAAHGFVRRIPGVDLTLSKAEMLERLAPWHTGAVEVLGFSAECFYTAEQVHGADIGMVTERSPRHTPGVDGLMTDVPGLLLGIHVADCGPVYILDPVRRAVALLHSGKHGSRLGIAGRAVRMMSDQFGSQPDDLVVQIGPCIRVPQYDIDFVSEIVAGCLDTGVPAAQVHDCGACTALRPDDYYSYRRDRGKTGRLLALLGLRAHGRFPNTR